MQFNGQITRKERIGYRVLKGMIGKVPWFSYLSRWGRCFVIYNDILLYLEAENGAILIGHSE